ncbi:hypothetical protein [Nakamurella leprariae]|uniref:Uncharacterized protein n=1 Tax=Nakamurella leprariae TaxID=2803911 RepID=A0A938Y7J1_9ACTN|nr:hypothetical protein [Nakamurella leprariae]MBM9467265.1 hypothetical protein [Nakamurella leprariae]
MADLLVLPLRLAPDGAFHTAAQGSDEQITDQIAATIGTAIGERPMCWPFGIADPTFDELTKADVQAAVSRFGPDGVVIDAVTTTWTDATTAAAAVEWSRT